MNKTKKEIAVFGGGSPVARHSLLRGMVSSKSNQILFLSFIYG